MNQYILIFVLLITVGCLYGQKEVRGKVVDEQGLPLIGVTVKGVQSGRGTITDLEGEYQLQLPENEKALEFTYVGMEKRVAVLKDRTIVNVTLKEQAELIDEVVVTAYRGGVAQSELVGSYSQASNEDLETERPVESIDQLMEGKLAGVQVETNTGEPGLPVKIRIRGEGSLVRPFASDIGASAQPLFVLDGVPLFDVNEFSPNQSEFNQLNETQLNPLAQLNPADIASITVLKDAAATAIYGANASNGVILITTKKGKEGKGTISFSQTTGVSHFVNDVKLLSSSDYVQLYRERLFNDSESPEAAGSTDIFTDWRDIARRNGLTINSTLSFQGGSAKSRYRFSLGYFKTNSIARRNDLERYTAKINLDQEFNSVLSLATSINLSQVNKEAINTFTAQAYPPNISPTSEDGSLNEEGIFASRPNPLSVLDQNENEHRNYDISGHTKLSARLRPWLSVSSLFGINLFLGNQRQYFSALNATGRNRQGLLALTGQENFRWISSTRLTGGFTIHDKHKLQYIGGIEWQDRMNIRSRTQGTGFLSDATREMNFAQNFLARSSQFRDALVSGFVDLSYNYDYRYYLSLSWRRDASSLFGGDVERGDFSAMGVGWTFTEESFFRIPWLTFGKVKASLGTTGNSRFGSYLSRGTYSIGNNLQYGGIIGAFPNNVGPNPDLTWEKTTMFNVSVSLEFVRSIRAELSFYNNLLEDAISSVSVPEENGFSTIISNNGSTRNWGYELDLSGTIFSSKNWRWRTGCNIALNRNRILSIPVERISVQRSIGLRIGEDVNTIYGVKFAGVDPLNGEPLYQLPSGEITDNRDQAFAIDNWQPIGRNAPFASGGWTNRFRWKKVELTVFLNYSWGGDFLISEFYVTDGRQISFLNQSVNQQDRWQEPGDITYVPRLSLNAANMRNTSRLLFDNDFIELNNINLSYRPFDESTRSQFLRSLQLGLSVNRLGIWYVKKNKADRNGPREYRYEFPRARTYSFTCKASL